MRSGARCWRKSGSRRMKKAGKRKWERGNVVTQYSIAVLPGDGIGPEVIAEAERVLRAAGQRFGIQFTLSHFPVGAAAVAAAGDPLPGETPAAVPRANPVPLRAGGGAG